MTSSKHHHTTTVIKLLGRPQKPLYFSLLLPLNYSSDLTAVLFIPLWTVSFHAAHETNTTLTHQINILNAPVV